MFYKEKLIFYFFVLQILNLTSNELKQYWCSRGHFNFDQAKLFKDLSDIVKPKYILETGFCTGRSASSLLASQKDIIKFISIDINLDYMKPDGRIYSELLMRNYKSFTVIENDSTKILDEHFFKINFPNGIDWVTIDGDHSYFGCTNDLVNSSKYLNHKGVIVIDDYKSGPPNGVTIMDVTKSVDDFISNNKNYKKIEWNIKGKGICIITKSNELYDKISKLLKGNSCN